MFIVKCQMVGLNARLLNTVTRYRTHVSLCRGLNVVFSTSTLAQSCVVTRCPKMELEVGLRELTGSRGRSPHE